MQREKCRARVNSLFSVSGQSRVHRMSLGHLQQLAATAGQAEACGDWGISVQQPREEIWAAHFWAA